MNTEGMELMELVPVQNGEPRMKALVVWDEFRDKALSLKTTAETLTVTNVSQVAEMKLARATRLTIKELRVAITHKHKELKAGVLEEGRKIDAGKNELLAILEPLENRLLLQETFVERETKRIADELRAQRTQELTPYLSSTVVVDLSALTEDQYATLLRDSIAIHNAKLEREKAEREAAEAARKAELERIEAQRVENERLKVEAAKQESERKAIEIEKARLLKQLEDERKVAQIKADEQAARVRAEKEAIAKKEKAARDAIELKARLEREAVEAAARKEREAREKIEAEIAAQKAAEEKAKRDAELAPDREKLLEFAKQLWKVPAPQMSTERGKAFIGDAIDNLERLVAYINNQARNL